MSKLNELGEGRRKKRKGKGKAREEPKKKKMISDEETGELKKTLKEGNIQ